MHTIYLKSPGGFEEWKAIAQQFETEWNFSRYCFSFVDIGGYGRDNDASIFSQTGVYKAFTNNEMGIPELESKHEIELPHVLVLDEIFPLKPWLMKPYPGKGLPESKKFLITGCHGVGERLKTLLAFLQQNGEFSEDQFVQTLKQWKR